MELTLKKFVYVSEERPIRIFEVGEFCLEVEHVVFQNCST